jgi:hypothetical protein
MALLADRIGWDTIRQVVPIPDLLPAASSPAAWSFVPSPAAATLGPAGRQC